METSEDTDLRMTKAVSIAPTALVERKEKENEKRKRYMKTDVIRCW